MTQELMQTKPDTFYQILEVEADAHTEIIDLSFRRLAKEYHPDRNAASDAMSKMQDLNGAYSVLKNRMARQAYDSLLAGKAKLSANHSAKQSAKQRVNQINEWCRNGSLLVCVVILAGLIYQFVNPPMHAVASNSVASNEVAPIISSNDFVEPMHVLRVGDVVDLSVAQGAFVPDNAMVKEPIEVDAEAMVLQIPPTSTAVPTPRPTAIPTQTPSALAFMPTQVP